mmetsp:Transcript_83366/g.122041  ORF Transcript_83366/g.122041 Transcript_83366/m.122041 type:complete len:120 (-) Transcript_83366:1005-1364(-)
MDINECWFCGSRIYPGHGSLFVKNNCENLYFCRSKCKKLFKLGKNPEFLAWCFKNRKKKGKCLFLSSRLLSHEDFNRNSPKIYNKFILKFMYFLMKRFSKQNIRNNIMFQKIIKKNDTK